MKRRSFQRGWITLKKRARGPNVWVFRFREGDNYRSIILGDIKKLPTKAAAEKEAEKHRVSVGALSRSMNISEAITKYIAEDMTARESSRGPAKSWLEVIRGRWGKTNASAMIRDLIEVEAWLNGLQKRKGGDLSKKSKQHVKQNLYALFESIMRWGGLELQRNPIDLLRIKGRPATKRNQVIVSIEQYEALLKVLPIHVGTMAQLAMCLGLRASEILGLRWEDFNFSTGYLNISRSVVGKHQDLTKTEASEDDLPLHPELVAALLVWKESKPSINGWVFGSPMTGRPYHRDSLQADYLGPAGKTVKISNLGWHAFRHTYRAMLSEKEVPMEVQQRLMRHADIRTTTQYGGRENKNLRKHNATVVEMVQGRMA